MSAQLQHRYPNQTKQNVNKIIGFFVFVFCFILESKLNCLLDHLSLFELIQSYIIVVLDKPSTAPESAVVDDDDDDDDVAPPFASAKMTITKA